MGILNLASAKSCYQGYQYYKENRIFNIENLEDSCYQALALGSENESYKVRIDLKHTRSSSCSCPYAAGRRVICKHIVALYFAIFPEEAKKYYDNAIKQEEELEDYQIELAEKLENYVRKLTREEAQDRLLEVLAVGPDWLEENFIRNYIEL